MLIQGAAAIVTGAASGLGAATAAALAARGARVVGFDLPDAVGAAPRVPGVELTGVDVTDYDQVAEAVSTAAVGSSPVRIVVSCAGIAPSARLVSRAGAHDPGLFAKVIAVNLVGTFNVMSCAVEHMAGLEPLAGGQRGVVINTASIAAFEGQVGQVAYAASKGGVAAMGLPAARDLARHGVRVNTIAPGLMETPMLTTVAEEVLADLAGNVPFPKRLGQPTEYADLACFIVEHDYLNGEVVRMDGALRMS